MSAAGGPPRVLILVVAATLAGAPGSFASATPWRDPAVAEADSLIARGSLREAMAVLGRSVDEGRRARSPERELQALLKRGLTSLYFLRDPRSALRDGARAESLAITVRDSARWCLALRIQGVSRLDRDDFRRARPLLERLEALARACNARADQGIALASLGYIDLELGNARKAQSRYRAALRCLADRRQPFYWIQARMGLARAYSGAGDADSATAIFEEVADEARKLGIVTAEAHALNNLGVNEWRHGDPALAADYWDRAIRLMRRQNARHEMVTPAMHRAQALLSLGRIDEGARVVESVMDSLWDVAPPSERRTILLQSAQLKLYQGRPREALGQLERYFVDADSVAFGEMVLAVDRLGRAYLEAGDAAAALAAIRRQRDRWNGSGGKPSNLGGSVELQALLALGRPREVLAKLRDADRERVAERTPGAELFAAMIEMQAQRALGERARAVAASKRALRAWERYRGTSRDPDWREARGRSRDLALAVADFALTDPAGTPETRARAAFDAVQVFRARTLSERMSGGAEPAPSTLMLRADSLQRHVLEPDELYVEFHTGTERTLLLALTRTTCRVAWLPSSTELETRVRRFLDLVLAGSGGASRPDPALVDRAARGLGGALLPGLDDLVARSRRILVSPDGPLCALPFALLHAQGDEELLIERAEVAVIPSAGVLRAARRRVATEASGENAQLFALAGGRDAAGEPLRGAAKEIAWLEREFDGVHAPPAGSIRSIEDARKGMSAAAVIHVAAHTPVDEQAPWRSGIALTAPPRARVLHAAEVAHMHLTARLAVLAGCRTIGARRSFGEGPQGLATGFLAAGVPAAVATLWQVDDERTIAFARRFYGHLAKERTVGAALREAQLDLRREEAGRDPFVWAAFTLLGDPGTTVHLVARGGASHEPGAVSRRSGVTKRPTDRQSP